MSWELNELVKITEVSYTTGTPAIPGTEGTAGSPSYTYWEDTQVGGGTYTGGPPTGWDTVYTYQLPGGATQTIRTDGYRYFNGEKAYLVSILAGVVYIYTAPPQTVRTLVIVPAVPSTPATPGTPGTPAEVTEQYNFGWNSGAVGPTTLAVNTVFTYRMSAGNVGSVVGLTLSTAPQDAAYTGMALSIMAQSGWYQLYRGGAPLGSSARFTNGTVFAFSRTNEGTIEVYASGGLIHTEALPDDVVVDSSLYSGGDVIWDAQELDVVNAPLNTNIAAPTLSDAQAVAAAIAVTRTLGPGTALGVAGAATASSAVNGSVKVNGSVLTAGDATTVTAAVGDGSAIGAVVTLGPGTARGVAEATTVSAAVAAGDTGTGVGISTNTSISSDMGMLPLSGAASGPGVAGGWTGNYVGDSMNMEPMTSSSSGDLAAPVIGVGDCIMVPMSNSATGLTGEVTTLPNTGDITDPDGDDSGTNPAVIELTGTFEEGTVIYIEYSTDSGGNSTIIYTVPADADAATVLADLEAVIEAQPDLVSDVVGSTIELEPEAPATTVTLLWFQIFTTNAAFKPMAMFASSEVTYSQGQGYMQPMSALGGDEDYPQAEVGFVDISEVFYAVAVPLELRYVNLITDSMNITDVINTFYNPVISVTEQIIATDRQLTAFILQVAEQMDVADSMQINQLVNLAERLAASGVVTTLYHGIVELLSGMTVSDTDVGGTTGPLAAYVRTVTDAFTVGDAQQLTATKLAQIIEAMTINSLLTTTLTIMAEVSEELAAGDSIELTAQLLAEILDTAGVFAMLKTPDELAQGWVMNTEGTLPVSEYDNFNFNSLTSYRGEFYGTTDAGLYMMGADDDAGAGITAQLSSLMLDLGSSRMKRIRSAYLGYTAGGELILKVRSVSDGQLSEHWYKALAVTAAEAPRAGYVRVGQGLKSRYWQFELTNVDGADFEIDQLELHPLFLGRRT